MMAKKYYVNHPYKPRRRRRLLVIATVAVLVLAVATIGVRQVYYRSLGSASQNSTPVEVTVPSGATVDQISKILSQRQLIRSRWAFKLYVQNQDAASVLQAGTYKLQADMTISEIVAVLTRGKVVTDLITILPGQTIADVRETLVNAGYSQSVVDEAIDPAQYEDVPILVDKPATASLEGFLYPDSYQKDSSTTPQDVIRAALAQTQKRLTTDVRSEFASQGLSVYQGLTLASIVEREVSRESDKPIVAQVFLKRLRENISLGSDVTAFYGAELAGAPETVAYDSPYNTRIYKGLTPTPISAPSQSSITAVAQPSDTDWLFFVAGDDGTTHFSRTDAEHEALVRRYCTKLCQ